MPYILPEDRTEQLYLTSDIYVSVNRRTIGEAMGQACRNGGDFQYILAVAINQYLKDKGLNYQHCQDVMGALTGALGEFQARVVKPYEDIKIVENGGVYDVLPDDKEY